MSLGRTAHVQQAAPAAKDCTSVLFQLLEPDMEVVLSLLRPVLQMQERQGWFPRQVTIPDQGSWKPRTAHKGAKQRCFQINLFPTCLKMCWASFVMLVSFLPLPLLVPRFMQRELRPPSCRACQMLIDC